MRMCVGYETTSTYRRFNGDDNVYGVNNATNNSWINATDSPVGFQLQSWVRPVVHFPFFGSLTFQVF